MSYEAWGDAKQKESRHSMNPQIPDESKKTEISPLPWRSVYPLGSKQRCAAIEAGDHYVMLYVAEADATEETIRMHQANADFIVALTAQHERDQEAIAKLKDPATVHVNILRGTIALTKGQAIHIAGLPADVEDQLIKLCEENARLKEHMSSCENCYMAKGDK